MRKYSYIKQTVRTWKTVICFTFSLLAVFSCTEDIVTSRDTAMIQVSISDFSTGVTTRAVPSELTKPLQEAFRLQISDVERSKVVYFGFFQPSLGPFRPGKYTLTATCGENKLALNAPFYTGKCSATLLAGFENIYTIQAKVANALLSARYAEKEALDSYFSHYGIYVTLNGQTVELPCEDTTQSAYFPEASSITVEFRGTVRETGEARSQDLTTLLSEKLPLNAGEHLIMQVGLSYDKINVVKADVEQVTIAETIPASWLPKPRLAPQGFDASGKITNVETNDVANARIDYTASMATQDIELTLNFQDEGYKSLNGTYTLSTLSATQKAQLTQIGIVLPELGTTSGEINLTQLASNLLTNKGVTTSNKIGLRVKANDRWSSDTPQTYTIDVEKPLMTVSAQDINSWSKEFTIDEVVISSGNAQKIKSNLKYQFSPDGNTWTDCNDIRRQKFATQPSVKAYFVRALYRGAVASSVANVTLENPTQLPNSGMEDWYYTNVARSINCYYPWAQGGSEFWNTNNTYTTRYVSSVGIFNAGSNPYNCFPAVSYVVGGHSGTRAAEIRSTASGRGNTLPSNVRNLNKVPGELFTGGISVTMGGTAATPSGDKYTIDEGGRSFDSRPTALKFWYKYNMLNTDKWRARIVLQDASHNVIIEKELQSTGSYTDWTEQTVTLDYQDGQQYAKCKYIYVVFSSSIYRLSDDMPWQKLSSYALWENSTLVTKDATACWLGSILTIDDISLVYDK